MKDNKLFNLGILACSLVLVVHAAYMLWGREVWWFIANVNLVFHEAGHVLLFWAPTIMMLLGGAIFEIGVPLVVIVHFLLKKHYPGVIFGCWWLVGALLSVSIYASDAREQQLPLLGGEAVMHDWHEILGAVGWLAFDDVIGVTIYVLAILIWCAMVWLWLHTLKYVE